MKDSLIPVIFTVAILFFASLLSTLFGAIVGAIVGVVFPQVVEGINTIAQTDFSSWVIGAILGFVGSFFRSTQSCSCK